jgi:hypothetical protein
VAETDICRSRPWAPVAMSWSPSPRRPLCNGPMYPPSPGGPTPHRHLPRAAILLKHGRGAAPLESPVLACHLMPPGLADGIDVQAPPLVALAVGRRGRLMARLGIGAGVS